MLKRIAPLALVTLLLCSFSPGFLLSESQARIEGVIVDGQTNRPLAGVLIYPLSANRVSPLPTSTYVTSDAEGHFVMDVSPGRYRLVPKLNGYVYSRPARLQIPQTGPLVQVLDDTRTLSIELPMIRQSSVTGQLINANGQPAAGVPISLGRWIYERTPAKRISSMNEPYVEPSRATTNDRGEYRFYGLQPGTYFVLLRRPLGSVPTYYYYPGVGEEVQASPITVGPNEEVSVGSMTIKPSEEARVRFHFPSLGTRVTKTIRFESGVLSLPATADPGEIVVQLASGTHEMMIGIAAADNRLFYSHVRVDVRNEDIDQEIVLNPGFRVTGSIKLTDLNGTPQDTEGLRCLLFSEALTVYAVNYPVGCIGGQYSPGRYHFEMMDLPPDAYVVSARASDRNVLIEGLDIDKDVQLDIELATPGSVISGRVNGVDGVSVASAFVALVPDAPLRSVGAFYRTVVSNFDGSYELRGIAPGSYHLIAWSELEGEAYRDAAFMKQYDDRGTPVQIETKGKLVVDLRILDQSKPDQN